MGYSGKVTIKKPENSPLLCWVGDKNLYDYDKDFEKLLEENTTEFYKIKSK